LDLRDRDDLPAEPLIAQAIRKRVCVQGVYNRTLVVLAPHSLFIKNDAPFLRAVTVEHGGRRPREAKLGEFKLAGLTEVQPTKKLFAKSIFPAGGLPDAQGG
jgi:hypothetical protein